MKQPEKILLFWENKSLHSTGTNFELVQVYLFYILH